jgi:hypothetical protein
MCASKPAAYIGGSPRGRKLVAVVHADMVAYSHLIGWTTSARLKACARCERRRSTPPSRSMAAASCERAAFAAHSFDSIEGATR